MSLGHPQRHFFSSFINTTAFGLLGPLLYIHNSRPFDPGARLDPTFASVVALRVLVLYHRPSPRVARNPGSTKPTKQTNRAEPTPGGVESRHLASRRRPRGKSETYGRTPSGTGVRPRGRTSPDLRPARGRNAAAPWPEQLPDARPNVRPDVAGRVAGRAAGQPPK